MLKVKGAHLWHYGYGKFRCFRYSNCTTVYCSLFFASYITTSIYRKTTERSTVCCSYFQSQATKNHMKNAQCPLNSFTINKALRYKQVVLTLINPSSNDIFSKQLLHRPITVAIWWSKFLSMTNVLSVQDQNSQSQPMAFDKMLIKLYPLDLILNDVVKTTQEKMKAIKRDTKYSFSVILNV